MNDFRPVSAFLTEGVFCEILRLIIKNKKSTNVED